MKNCNVKTLENDDTNSKKKQVTMQYEIGQLGLKSMIFLEIGPKSSPKRYKIEENRSTERFECKMVPRTAPRRVPDEKLTPFWSHLARKWPPEGRQWDPLGVDNGTKNRKMSQKM